MVNQLFCALTAMLGFAGGQHRHKGLTESALTKHPPEQVWNTKGNMKSVSQCADTEKRGHQHIAHQASQARRKG